MVDQARVRYWHTRMLLDRDWSTTGGSPSLPSTPAPDLDVFVRLVRILSEPHLVRAMAPLIRQEVTIRLLTGPHGPQLQHLVTVSSPSQQIARAIAWLRDHFVRPQRVDELAARAHMSPSTFRDHFRTLTGVSSVQFQKQLRLQDARQLMLTRTLDAGSAALRVGYESASQFSREYRLFGAPPQRDIKQLRLEAGAPLPASTASANSAYSARRRDPAVAHRSR